jgi:radical SAM protein with 4Fe4S-binding SPASM domain
LTPEEARDFLNRLAVWARPILIFTGGETLLRSDIFDLLAQARDLGFRTALATCGGPLTPDTARRIREVGVGRVSVSIDGPTADTHDDFRGVKGAFDAALRGIGHLRDAEVPFQVNTTVTRHNAADLHAILALAVREKAAAFDAFLLVPTGRGRELADQELSPEEYEETLAWLADQRDLHPLRVRTTCAPHFQRILRGRKDKKTGHGLDTETGGCLGGKSFAFVSYNGTVQICGFLDIEAGRLRETGMDLAPIWQESPFLLEIRNTDGYGGKCGICEYRNLCGGCRARAYAVTGDYLASEPFCTYEPRSRKEKTPE